ncbi:MAG: hypothetical protein ACE5E5_02955 [Phycisphaerae bacterium]
MRFQVGVFEPSSLTRDSERAGVVDMSDFETPGIDLRVRAAGGPRGLRFRVMLMEDRRALRAWRWEGRWDFGGCRS